MRETHDSMIKVIRRCCLVVNWRLHYDWTITMHGEIHEDDEYVYIVPG